MRDRISERVSATDAAVLLEKDWGAIGRMVQHLTAQDQARGDRTAFTTLCDTAFSGFTHRVNQEGVAIEVRSSQG